MIALRAQFRLFAALAALAALAACGDDSSPDPAAAATEAAADESSSDDAGSDDDATDDDAGDDDDAEESGDEASSVADVFDVLDADYTQGSAHVEVSGDADVTEDYSAGGGFSTDGVTSLSFTNDNGLLGIAVDPGSTGGISFSSGDFASGGAFPDQCSIDITQNDESELAGTFECDGAPAVEGSSTDVFVVDIEGTFSVSPS